MAVFSIAPDGGATPLDPVHCRDEDRDLQKLLAQNPEILPGDQIRPEDPCRWLLVRREVPVADPATGSNRWSIDHVFADQDAVPTLVECKRFADSRARREVVGQMLEYAANGQHYWEPEELEKLAVRTAAEAGTSLEEALAALEPTGSQSPEEFFAAFARNLREGRVRLVFFLEEAPFELKSIVEFLNRQMERTEVLIVEARQYTVEGRRIVIPSLFGFSEEARRVKRAGGAGGPARRWTAETFLASARDELSDAAFHAVERLLGFSREQGFEISWGSGQRLGSFKVQIPEISRHTLFAVYTNGRINWYFGYLNENDRQRAFRNKLSERLILDFAAEFPPDLEKRYPALPIEKWAGRESALQTLLIELIEEYRKEG
jgi:hypothetical protein